MKILVTGAMGMLAREVREKFFEHELILSDVAAGEVEINGQKTEVKALDITDQEAVKKFVQEVRPELIINCAAYTNVDAAETQTELAEKINAIGPANLAEAAESIGAILIHISTDYVFGGDLPKEQEYAEEDPKNPDTVYGKTKLKGEEEIAGACSHYYIFRTAWLYGPGGKNFVNTMISVGREKDVVTVVNDQYGSPTYAKDLAEMIYQAVLQKIPFGVYNATNEGFTTWAGFTEKIYELAGISCMAQGISSEEYEMQATKRAAATGQKRVVAKRPKNSKLSKEKLISAGVAIRSWEEALEDYLTAEQASGKGNHD